MKSGDSRRSAAIDERRSIKPFLTVDADAHLAIDTIDLSAHLPILADVVDDFVEWSPFKLARDGFGFDIIGLSFHLDGATSFFAIFSFDLVRFRKPVLLNCSLSALSADRLPFICN